MMIMNNNDSQNGEGTERETWSSGGHLTVQREVNKATNLVEVWELEELSWHDEDRVGSYDVVKIHIARSHDVPASGVPHGDSVVSNQCSWNEVPDEVKQEFLQQAGRIDKMFELLESGEDQ